ncbi:MAG: ABC transporter permease [Akkermansia sp.]
MSKIHQQTSSQAEKGTSLWRDALLRLTRNKAALISLTALLIIALACFMGPLIPTLPNPNNQELSLISEGVSLNHWFGTDQLGRDLFARVLYGGRISLLVGIVATGVSLIIGVIYGLISGYAGGKIDALMMRSVDILFALPFIVLIIIFSLTIQEPSDRLTAWVINTTGWSTESVAPITGLIPLFIAIGALGWLTLARIVRTQTIELKNQEFVEAARSLGLSHTKILLFHIAPNLLGPVIIYTTLAVPGIMLLEAVLSFLGLGVKAPNSSWGTLIKEGADRMEITPELLLFPAILFSITLLALNFLGDGLRDALDPKSSKD